ncbi:MAG TPA: small basic protein [Planctomycetota bacterium]|nr:small basic protein [Planctomycetota bacterium]
MTMHQSLVLKSSHARARNVLNRYERILELRKTQRFDDDRSPYGLPKVRILRLKKRGKKEKKKKEDE